MHNNPILRISTKILFAPIILFGLYVQFHGDFGPGGGFQAGVIVASAFILYSLVFGIEAGKKLFPSNVNLILLAFCINSHRYYKIFYLLFIYLITIKSEI